MLQEMSQWCLREETLKAANALLVNLGIFAYPPEKVYFSILQLAWA